MDQRLKFDPRLNVRRWAKTSFGGLPATFWWLWLFHLIYWAGRFIMIFLSLFLTVEIGLSPSSMGLYVALFGAGGVVSVLFGGTMADLVGRRLALHASLLSSAILAGFLSTTPTGPWLGAILFLLGLASFAAKPVFETFMVDVVDSGDRHRAYSLNYIAINLGFIISPPVAAILVERSFRTMMVAEALGLLVVAALVSWRIPNDRRSRHDSAPTGPPAGLATVFKDRMFVGFVTLNLMFMVVLMQNTISLPIFMAEEGYSTTGYAALLSLNGVILILFQIPVSNRVVRYRASMSLVLATGLMALGYAIYPFATNWWVLALGVTVWTAGELINMPTAAWIASRYGPLRLRGRYLGFFALTSALAFMIGPIVGGYLLEFVGSEALWFACSAMMVVVAILRFFMAKAQEVRISESRDW